LHRFGPVVCDLSQLASVSPFFRMSLLS
jgi:hypothetical protein